jgi:hypothetical protein
MKIMVHLARMAQLGIVRIKFLLFVSLLLIGFTITPYNETITSVHAAGCEEAGMRILAKYEAVSLKAGEIIDEIRNTPPEDISSMSLFGMPGMLRDKYNQAGKDREEYFRTCPNAPAKNKAILNEADQVAFKYISEMESAVNAAKAKRR